MNPNLVRRAYQVPIAPASYQVRGRTIAISERTLRQVLVAIAGYAQRYGGLARCSEAQIAELTRLNDRTVRRARAALRAQGLIKTRAYATGGRHRASEVILAFDDPELSTAQHELDLKRGVYPGAETEYPGAAPPFEGNTRVLHPVNPGAAPPQEPKQSINERGKGGAATCTTEHPGTPAERAPRAEDRKRGGPPTPLGESILSAMPEPLRSRMRERIAEPPPAALRSSSTERNGDDSSAVTPAAKGHPPPESTTTPR